MNKNEIASVIETSPVRLTSDETRAVLRCYQSTKPVKTPYSSRDMTALLELGIVERVPIETETARAGRLIIAWSRLKKAAIAKELDVAHLALKEISDINRSDEPESGYVLTEIGKQVARGITVRMTKR